MATDPNGKNPTPPAETPPAETPPAIPPATTQPDRSTLPEWARRQLEELEGKAKDLEATRKEAASARKKLDAYEEAERKAKEEAEKRKPLEERLTSAEQKAAEAEKALEAERSRARTALIRSELLTAGVAKEWLEQAAALVKDEDYDTKGEERVFNPAKFFSRNPFLLAKGGKPVVPQPGGSGNSAQGSTFKRSVSKNYGDPAKK